MRRLLLLPLLGLLAAGGVDDVEAGLAAYRAERWDEAFARLSAAAEGDASGALLLDLALAALRAGDPLAAEVAAERAAAAGESLRADFVLGLAAFARCRAAAAQAEAPDAPPEAFDPALAAAADARDAWTRALLASDGDWPEARRNLERALREAARLEALRERAREAALRRRAEAKPRPVPPPEELLKRLDEKEQEKLELRRTTRRALRQPVEKDW